MAEPGHPAPTNSRLSAEGVQKLMSWIKAGQNRDKALFDKMSANIDRLRGISPVPVVSPDIDSAVRVNLSYLHARTLAPTLFAKEPYVDCQPETDADAPSAPIWEALINNTIAIIKFKRQARLAIQYAIPAGEGWIKVGWTGPTQPVTAPGPTPTQSPDFFEEAVRASGHALDAPPPQTAEAPKAPRTKKGIRATGDLGNPASWLLRNGPFVVPVDPRDVIVDPLVEDRDPLRARFVAIRYYRPLSEIRATPGYEVPRDLDKSKLRDATTGDFLYSPTTTYTVRDKERKNLTDLPDGLILGTIWEVWVSEMTDIGVHRRVITLLEGAERPIRDVPYDQVLGKHFIGMPVYRLALDETPGGPPMGEFDAWASLEDTMTWLLRKALSSVKRYSRTVAINPDKLVNAKTAMDQLRAGADGTVIEVRGDVREAIVPVPWPTNSADHYQLMQLTGELAQLISGISENRKGEATARTATEAAIIEGATKVKMEDKQDIVTDFCEDVLYGIVALLASFVTREMTIRATGTAGALSWVHVTPKALQQIPAIKIRFESTKYSAKQQELQRWQVAMQWLLQMKGLLPNLRVDIALMHALRALGIENVLELVGNPLSQDQREAQWAEIALMVSGIDVQPRPDEPQQIHRSVIEEFRGTPAYPALLQSNPMAVQRIEEHDMRHAELEAQNAQAAGAEMASSNMRAEDNIATSAEPANEARGDRPEPVPGMSNQLAPEVS